MARLVATCGTMDYMLVTPLPGTTPEQLQKTLMELHSAVHNVWSGHSDFAQGKLTAYLGWTANAVQHLANQISPADLDRLVLTPGYGAPEQLTGRGVTTATDLGELICR
jgi:hypothetical protein